MINRGYDGCVSMLNSSNFCESENSGLKCVQEFNFYYTSQSLQLLKVIFPYLHKQAQRNIAVYIKFMELKYTLQNNQRYPYGNRGNTEKLIDNLLDVSTGKERETFASLKTTFETVQKMQETMEMIQMMQEMFPEGTGMFDFESILKEVMPNGPPHMDG